MVSTQFTKIQASAIPSMASWFSFVFVFVIFANAESAQADIFTGPPITFTKDAFVDETLAANQDRITDNVWITRDVTMGIFNIAVEANYTSNFSPADTEWAFEGLNGNASGGAFGGAANFANLVFANWQSAHLSNPPSTVGLAAVVHLISEDHYIDISFDAWGVGGGGSFTYTRATQAIPEPATTLALLLGLGVTSVRRRRA